MKKMYALFVLTAVALHTVAVAQPIDPDPDGMGMYFGDWGSERCLIVDDWTPGIGNGVTIVVYLLVTRPSTSLPYIQGWEAHVEIDTNSYLPTTSLTLSPGAINLAKNLDDYVVVANGDAAIPSQGHAVTLATAELVWLGPEGHAWAEIRLGGVEGSLLFPDSPGYYSDDSAAPTPCRHEFGPWGAYTWVNGNCIWVSDRVVDENLTWGEVKSLD